MLVTQLSPSFPSPRFVGRKPIPCYSLMGSQFFVGKALCSSSLPGARLAVGMTPSSPQERVICARFPETHSACSWGMRSFIAVLWGLQRLT